MAADFNMMVDGLREAVRVADMSANLRDLTVSQSSAVSLADTSAQLGTPHPGRRSSG
jgi:hypothetical protein